jgi:hypothetical protein
MLALWMFIGEPNAWVSRYIYMLLASALAAALVQLVFNMMVGRPVGGCFRRFVRLCCATAAVSESDHHAVVPADPDEGAYADRVRRLQLFLRPAAAAWRTSRPGGMLGASRYRSWRAGCRPAAPPTAPRRSRACCTQGRDAPWPTPAAG